MKGWLRDSSLGYSECNVGLGKNFGGFVANRVREQLIRPVGAINSCGVKFIFDGESPSIFVSIPSLCSIFHNLTQQTLLGIITMFVVNNCSVSFSAQCPLRTTFIVDQRRLKRLFLH